VIREADRDDLAALVDHNLHVQRLHVEAEGEPFVEPTREAGRRHVTDVLRGPSVDRPRFTGW
jgi:hypothetical protein